MHLPLLRFLFFSYGLLLLFISLCRTALNIPCRASLVINFLNFCFFSTVLIFLSLLFIYLGKTIATLLMKKFFECLFFYSVNFIICRVVQPSSQPNFMTLPIPNPQPTPTFPTCLLW